MQYADAQSNRVAAFLHALTNFDLRAFVTIPSSVNDDADATPVAWVDHVGLGGRNISPQAQKLVLLPTPDNADVPIHANVSMLLARRDTRRLIVGGNQAGSAY